MGQTAKPVWMAELEGAEPEADYGRQWAAYRLRRRVALALSVAWLPVCCGLFALSRFRLHVPLLALLGMFLWLLAALLAVWWAGEFRCPRCRRRYAAPSPRARSKDLTRGLFDKVCANCKLRKFEPARRDT